MYATIRRYTAKAGAVDQKSLDDLKHRIEEGFLPTIQDVRGFHTYYAEPRQQGAPQHQCL